MRTLYVSTACLHLLLGIYELKADEEEDAAAHADVPAFAESNGDGKISAGRGAVAAAPAEVNSTVGSASDSASDSASTDEGLYLYEGFDDSDPIVDFLYTANSTRYPPPFLTDSAANGPRVVEYYAPWCGHCQHFKSAYVEFAREFKAAGAGAAAVEFYAVSCTAHSALCTDRGVDTYPDLRAYRSGNGTGIPVQRGPGGFTIPVVMELLGLPYHRRDGTENATESSERGKGGTENTRAGNNSVAAKRVGKKEVREEEEARLDAETRRSNKADVFHDASLSLDYALRHGIFSDSTGPLSSEKRRALHDWIELLRRALPPAMDQSRRQIEALAERFDSAVLGKGAFEKVVLQTQRLGSGRDRWSFACTHHDPLRGYTCGLWELLHVITVGVVEQNAEGPVHQRLATLDAGDTMRDFVDHFFGCRECRDSFVQFYDDCGHERCDRLTAHKDAPANVLKELPLWLWQTHNSVNVRLLHEKALRDGDPVPTPEDDQGVAWPKESQCPRCWNADGTWKKDEVYSFLRMTYWPEGMVPAVRLRKRIQNFSMTQQGDLVDTSISHRLVLPLAILALLWMIRVISRKRQKNRIGRSKKFDSLSIA